REANGPFGGPELTGETIRTLSVTGSACGIPASAAAYYLTATAYPKTSLGYLTMWGTGARPSVSVLNSPRGTVESNTATVIAGDRGSLNLVANASTNLTIDLYGYFDKPGKNGLNFYPVAPCRVVDTRQKNGPMEGPSLKANEKRTLPMMASPCGLSAKAAAYF